MAITARDVEYHHPPDVDHTYAETNWFSFSIPEERLLVIVHTVSRKGVPAISSDVAIYGALVDNRAESLYFDGQQMLPAPERLSEYTLPSGLHVKAFSPSKYHIDYVGYDDTQFHIDFEGLMEPFDIHDPEHSPKAAPTLAEQHTGSGMGSGYGGHFDLTGHITGTLRLFCKEYVVDCVETMDHSWDSRAEIYVPSMGWSHSHFSKAFAIKWINHWDTDKPIPEQQRLAHGYVMEDGQAYGLTELELITNRVGNVITSMDVTATDKRGHVHHMHGSALMGGPWVCCMAALVQCATMRWQLDSGRVGYGLAAALTSMQSLTRRHGRRWTQASGHITA